MFPFFLLSLNVLIIFFQLFCFPSAVDILLQLNFDSHIGASVAHCSMREAKSLVTIDCTYLKLCRVIIYYIFHGNFTLKLVEPFWQHLAHRRPFFHLFWEIRYLSLTCSYTSTNVIILFYRYKVPSSFAIIDCWLPPWRTHSFYVQCFSACTWHLAFEVNTKFSRILRECPLSLWKGRHIFCSRIQESLSTEYMTKQFI